MSESKEGKYSDSDLELLKGLKIVSDTSKEFLRETRDNSRSLESLRSEVEQLSNGRNVEDRREDIRKSDMVLRISLYAMGIIISIQIAITGWIVKSIFDHEKRVVAIESNRFTSADGAKIMEMLFQLQNKLPKEVPPKWFLDRVEALERNVEEIRKKDRR